MHIKVFLFNTKFDGFVKTNNSNFLINFSIIFFDIQFFNSPLFQFLILFIVEVLSLPSQAMDTMKTKYF